MGVLFLVYQDRFFVLLVLAESAVYRVAFDIPGLGPLLS